MLVYTNNDDPELLDLLILILYVAQNNIKSKSGYVFKIARGTSS